MTASHTLHGPKQTIATVVYASEAIYASTSTVAVYHKVVFGPSDKNGQESASSAVCMLFIMRVRPSVGHHLLDPV